MDTLWAPWRMEYIKSEKPQGCIFCTKPKERDDEKNLIVARGETCFVIMNYYPYNNGHMMVVPYRHISELKELSTEERAEMMALLARSTEVLKTQMAPHGFNIGMNLGKAAGAGIDDHLHMHIVPRWSADTNFMPVLGHTKVVPDALRTTWKELYDLFNLAYSQSA